MIQYGVVRETYTPTIEARWVIVFTTENLQDAITECDTRNDAYLDYKYYVREIEVGKLIHK